MLLELVKTKILFKIFGGLGVRSEVPYKNPYCVNLHVEGHKKRTPTISSKRGFDAP